MVELLKRFMFDETAAIRFFRAALAAASYLVMDGSIGLPKWVGAVLMAVSLSFGSGEKNQKPPTG